MSWHTSSSPPQHMKRTRTSDPSNHYFVSGVLTSNYSKLSSVSRRSTFCLLKTSQRQELDVQRPSLMFLLFKLNKSIVFPLVRPAGWFNADCSVGLNRPDWEIIFIFFGFQQLLLGELTARLCGRSNPQPPLKAAQEAFSF